MNIYQNLPWTFIKMFTQYLRTGQWSPPDYHSQHSSKMSTEEIVTYLLNKYPDPQEPVFSVDVRDLLLMLVRTSRNTALTLTTEELIKLRECVRHAFDHHLDPREYISIGIDVWQLSREANQNARREAP